MTAPLSGRTIRLQILSTFIALFFIYLVFEVFKVEESDLIGEVLFVMFKPFFSIAAGFVTICICLIVGLPLRLINTLSNWWIQKPLAQVLLLAIGLLLLILSANTHFALLVSADIAGAEVLKSEPNRYLALSGWFITAFSMLHFYPRKIVIRVKRKIYRSRLSKAKMAGAGF